MNNFFENINKVESYILGLYLGIVLGFIFGMIFAIIIRHRKKKMIYINNIHINKKVLIDFLERYIEFTKKQKLSDMAKFEFVQHRLDSRQEVLIEILEKVNNGDYNCQKK